jgi:hypothetical protein
VTIPLARSTALVTLVIIAGAPGVGIACGLHCDRSGHHGAAPHGHGTAPALSDHHAVHDGHRGHHHGTGSLQAPAVRSHHVCHHAPAGVHAVVQQAELPGGDPRDVTASSPHPAGAIAAPHTTGAWLAPTGSIPPAARASARALVLRL